MNRTNRTPLLIATLVAALGLGVGIGATTFSVLSSDTTTVVREVTVATSEPAAAGSVLPIGRIYRDAQPGVVEISAGSGTSQAQGSGWVYDSAGHVVTNQHVVEGASDITVRFANGSTHPATLVGTDPSTDLAVLTVDAPASLLRPLELGDSTGVAVGDAVVALGSPFGLEGTITSGIVSALHREMTAPNNFTINDSIQTDAAINHGNSGGPLLNMRGQVVGVNAQIESESGGNDGVGFAIPSNTVRAIVSQLVDTGEVEHAYLGITMVTTQNGVAVTEVKPGTPADAGDIKPATGMRTVDGERVPTGGDVIVAFDGKPIADSAELQSAVDGKKPGDEVSLTVVRDGQRTTIHVTLGTRPS